jgi:3-oxoacyl-[acyl-carrier-protein] synthase II
MAHRASEHRVVVTGIGVVTPLGSTVPQFWSSVVAGRSGIRPISHFDASRFPTRIAGRVPDLDESRAPTDGCLRRLLGRKDLFGWIAALDALDDARLNCRMADARIGAVIGTERRCPDVIERVADEAHWNDPLDHVSQSGWVLASVLAATQNLAGPHVTVAAACASSAQAVGMAYQYVRCGEADVMIAGGCDSMADPIGLVSFSRIGALSTRNDDPTRASRPFDLHRDGMVIGEGAGMLVLERLDHARARGASIYGEVLGYGSSSNAYRLTDQPPDGRGAALAMKFALDDAGLSPHAVDYINAHGTSTVQNDRSETAAIKKCFQDAAPSIPISSTKSMIGHLFSAGGAVEIIVCLLTILSGIITPTINYETPDPECDLDYVPNVSRRKRVDVALSNSSGFGGVNAAVVVGKVRADA